MPDQPTASAAPDVPAGLLLHDTGLSPQRLRELMAADDAYTRRPAEPRVTQDA